MNGSFALDRGAEGSLLYLAPLDLDCVCWVSSPESRHSRNIANRAAIAITVFDSTIEVRGAEAAYFDADASWT